MHEVNFLFSGIDVENDPYKGSRRFFVLNLGNFSVNQVVST